MHKGNVFKTYHYVYQSDVNEMQTTQLIETVLGDITADVKIF